MSETIIEPTTEILERICDAMSGAKGRRGAYNGVTFSDIHQHNSCNHVYSGTIDIEGVEYGFIIQDGDWNGTEVREWGLADDVGSYDPPPPPEPVSFIPVNDHLAWERPEMFGVYVAWRKESWFTEQQRKYAYDRHFQPGGYVEKHYRDWAATKGLKVGYLSDLERAIEHYRANQPANMPAPPKYKWNEDKALSNAVSNCSPRLGLTRCRFFPFEDS